ncbi:uncharacterized protein [Battus philenor]|uniref:uncharacterized protein n=1 Tax=Battus philenor TaxID=42288 RepID=UPI0035D09FE8
MRQVLMMLLLATAHCAPLHLLLHQKNAQSQQLLQHQLLELQRLQAPQRDATFAPLSMPPLLVLLPRASPVAAASVESGVTKSNADKVTVDDDLESVIIEAAPAESPTKPQKLVLLPGYARLSIGDIISAIPFLPIEINVPDAVGWAYGGISSGIASIISIFGRGQPQPTRPDTRTSGGYDAFILLPVAPQLIPIRLPIQV